MGRALLVMFTAIKNGHVQLSSNPVGTTSIKISLRFVANCNLFIDESPRSFLRTRLNMSVPSRSNLNLKVLIIEEMGKTEYPKKNLSEQGGEPITNSTHIWHRRWDLNLGHIGEKPVPSPLPHPCSL